MAWGRSEIAPVPEAAKADKTAKGRNTRLPSTGLKADKTDKTANVSVTYMTDVTVMTPWAVLTSAKGGQMRVWPPSRRPRRCLKAAKAANGF